MQNACMSNDEMERAITFGASICKKIKRLRPDDSWWKIASLFGAVKAKGSQYFPDMAYVDMLRSIDRNFSLEDIEEAIVVKQNGQCSM